MKITTSLCLLALAAAALDVFLTLGSLNDMPVRLDSGLRFKLLMDLTLCGLVTATIGAGRRLMRGEAIRTRGAAILCALTCATALADLWLSIWALGEPALSSWPELRGKLALDGAFATLCIGVAWAGLAMASEIQQERAQRLRPLQELTTEIFMQPLRDMM